MSSGSVMGRHADEALYPGEVFDGRWEIGRFLGDGNFSIVFECQDRISRTTYAIKILSVTQHSAEHLMEFDNDGELLELLAGRSNILEIHHRGVHAMALRSAAGVPVSVGVPFMVLAQADADLATLLIRRHELDWDERLDLFRQVVKGMHQMHLYEVVNRDLKAENVLLTAAGRSADVRLSDFGRGRDTRRTTRFSPIAYEAGRGDGRFSPPEMVWGLGDDTAEAMRLGDLYLIGSIRDCDGGRYYFPRAG
jgi:eukaryotic-like serine/threonine-protein kinase